jgi:hypothetical protein
LCYGVLLLFTNLRYFLDQSLRTSVKYRVNKPAEGEIYIYTKKILYKHTLAEAYLPIYGLITIKEYTQSDHLRWKQALHPLLGPRLTEAVYHNFVKKCSSRCKSAD